MDQKTLARLEFNKIVERLAARCRTAAGAESASSTDIATHPEEVRARLAKTTEMRRFIEEKRPDWDAGGVGDVRPCLKKLREGRILEPAELNSLCSLLEFAERVNAKSVSPSDYPTIAAIRLLFCRNAALAKEIAAAIDDKGNLRDDASTELAGIRGEIRHLEATIPEKLNRWMESGAPDDILQERIVTIRSGRFVVPIRSEFLHRYTWVLQDRSASGATSFVEPLFMLPDNNHLCRLRLQEKEEIYRILRAFTEEFLAHADELEISINALARLDHLTAAAELSAEMNAVEPLINDDGFINLTAARHPLLGGRAVPIDVRLGGDTRALVITGPNAGGKTVSMKTIGLLQCMAQAGLHIPAAHGTSLPVFQHIIAIIGDEQSIENSLSSFSSHLTEIKEMLEFAQDGTLVLIDEVCSGTDPEEGSALACGVLKYLIDSGALTTATSHQSRLKAFAMVTPGAANASMSFDEQTCTPSFRLEIGAPGRSYALEIAGRIGIPAPLLQSAHEFLGAGKQLTEKLIAELETIKGILEAEKGALERQRVEIRKEKDAARKKLEEAAAMREKVVLKACNEADKLLTETKQRCEEILIRARESWKLPDAAAVKGAIKTQQKKLEEHEKDARKPSPPLKAEELVPNMWLTIRDTGERGQLVSAPDKKGRIKLIVDGLHITTSIDNVEKLEQAPPPRAARKPDHTRFIQQAMLESKDEIDLHGLRVREALKV
ncbi:MAG: hypothetical protein AB1546_14475, partial [bacterium]